MYVGIAIDVLILVVMLVIIIRAAKKGFALSFFNLISFLCAFIIATIAAKYIPALIYEGFFKRSITYELQKSIRSFSDGVITNLKGFVSTKFPLIFSFSLLTGFNIDNTFNVTSYDSAAHSIEQNVIQPLALDIISIFVYLLALIISLPVLRFVSKKLSTVFTVSLVGKINTVLGAVLGVPKAFVIGFIITFALIIIASVLISPESVISEGIKNSFAIKFINSLLV